MTGEDRKPCVNVCEYMAKTEGVTFDVTHDSTEMFTLVVTVHNKLAVDLVSLRFKTKSQKKN